MADQLVVAHPPSRLNAALVWVVLPLTVSIALIAAADIKGGYVDEFWSIGFADSTIPLRNLFDVWSSDTGHPVGFSAINWLADPFIPQSLFVRRLLNLFYFACAVAIGALGAKGDRRFGMLFVPALAASPYLVERFAEYRATFLALMILAILVCRIRAAIAARRTTVGEGMFIATLLAAIAAIEYPVLLAGLALCGAWTLMSLRERNWRDSAVGAASAAVAMLVVVASLANASRFRMIPTPYYEPFSGLVVDVVVVIATCILPCLAMIGFSLAYASREPGWLLTAAFGTRFRRCILLAIALTLVSYVLVNTATHALIRRQLFGIAPLVVAYLADIASEKLRGRPLEIGLIALNLIAVSGATAIALKSKPYFNRFGPLMAQAQQSCPSLPIYAVLPERILGKPENRFPYIKDQDELGYDWIARRFGLRLQRGKPPQRWIDAKCGAIIWSEGLWQKEPPTPQLITNRLGLTLDPQSLRLATVDYVDQSMLMRVPPNQR